MENRNILLKNSKKLPLVEATSLMVWYKDAAILEKKSLISKKDKIIITCSSSSSNDTILLRKKKELGERLLAQYVQDYWLSCGQRGETKLDYALQRSGATKDRVRAMCNLIKDNPVANLRSIDLLLGMVSRKGALRHSFKTFEALREIFIILLPNRTLETLQQRPLNRLSDTKDGHSLLLFWHWEACLKERYERFLSLLEKASHDAMPELKNAVLKTIYALLKSKSGQDRCLLSLLVNKLGDPENKIASNAAYHLAMFLASYPHLKVLVIDEVDNFLFRRHLVLRAKCRAVNFLTEIRLTDHDDGPKVAKRLVDIYLALFKVLLSDTEAHAGLDSRIFSALLCGINRAFPFVSTIEAGDVMEDQTPFLYQLVHSKNFNVGVQALMLIDKILSRNGIASDRFYRALYAKLLLPNALTSSKEMFISLVLQSMKKDVNITRVAALSKRLLQVALQEPPQYACACLFLLSEALKARPLLWDMLRQNESADSAEDLEHFKDITENDENGVVFDPNNTYNKDLVAEPKNESGSDSDYSLDEGGSEEDDLHNEDELFGKRDFYELKGLKPTYEEGVNDIKGQTLPGGYETRHREPSYCNADRCGWWELTLLASHVHPSVAVMARTLLSGVYIVYNGKPLEDLALGAFLDKLMEKKPKPIKWHGTSQIEPAKKLHMNHELIGAEILSMAEEDVPPEDVVFHKFYMNKMNSSKKPRKKKKKTTEDEADEEIYTVDNDGGDEDESENEEIDKMVGSVDDPFVESEEGDYDWTRLPIKMMKT